ncbi:hypothetical protein [Vibrio sp. 10N.261.52.A1]|uniref:hypothetical protein n=1 Tax=Vibrio TaxID=662 RepID=UPI000C83E4E6|nr:hypothetical protein [Vibrio sp. 10N.261.52.A1]PML54708.1 hypothetical protein BCT81_01330 [Vibrio sp. 10N.261.52.A1]
MFKNRELQMIADWCNEREILPNRVVILDVKAACRSLGIAMEHSVSNEEIKEIESLMLKQ